jgi:hypothetical protein
MKKNFMASLKKCVSKTSTHLFSPVHAQCGEDRGLQCSATTALIKTEGPALLPTLPVHHQAGVMAVEKDNRLTSENIV